MLALGEVVAAAWKCLLAATLMLPSGELLMMIAMQRSLTAVSSPTQSQEGQIKGFLLSENAPSRVAREESETRHDLHLAADMLTVCERSGVGCECKLGNRHACVRCEMRKQMAGLLGRRTSLRCVVEMDTSMGAGSGWDEMTEDRAGSRKIRAGR